MKFFSALTTILLINVQTVATASGATASGATKAEPSSHISLVEFQSLLYSEINSEIVSHVLEDQQDKRLQGRFLRDQDVSPKALTVWDDVVQHGWDMSRSLNEKIFFKSSRDLQEAFSDQLATSPFLICSHSPKDSNRSGYQRLMSLMDRIEVHQGDFTVVRNDPDKTCYHISLQYETAERVRDSVLSSSRDDEYYTLLPMTDIMKIQFDTMNMISDPSWIVPSVRKTKDFERTLRVSLSAGHRWNLNQDDVLVLANSIINDVRVLGQNGAKNRRLRRLQGAEKEQSTSVSLTDLFSRTSLSANKKHGDGNSPLRYLRKAHVKNEDSAYPQHWSRALELGLEADHSCQAMFDSLELNVHFDNQGFDIVLNPSAGTSRKNVVGSDGIELIEDNERIELNDQETDVQCDRDGIECSKGSRTSENQGSNVVQCKHGIECSKATNSSSGNQGLDLQCNHGIECSSSASNKHCVASLVMALSTHPLVLSIESEGPISTNDYEAQWITQSKVVGKRPLRDIGITGSNQIISIIDSGLDINHKYFGPTDAKVFNGWDHSQRKVVRYDRSVGDITEPAGGHGTKVAGAAAGQYGYDEANGAAEGAKLHIFDIQVGEGAYMMPSSYAFFESMHSTDKRPARIANGSWNTQYRPYPFSCRLFDEALNGLYQGDLYVASAGNEGLDESSMKSKERTIGNPASCKNTLAVGGSQSYGSRVTAGAKGVDYLAAFSSRGPTFDGRMKPDLVAPGASVLTAYAQQNDKTVQAYGTSFAAPVVAGNAALVRQYFEDGKLPCGKVNCSLDPSGSLVKAVLMNSADTLKQVQISQPWMEKRLLEEVSEYDSNQGMGLVKLDTTLPIPGHNKFHAIVRNNVVISDKQFHDIYVKATPYKCTNTSYRLEFRATLSWYDPAGASSCAKCLVNDLDLDVTWVTQAGVLRSNSRVFPNGGSHKDYDNNVERIRFKMQGGRIYRIRVNAANLSAANTKFSLIATGCFNEVRNPAL